MKSKFAAVIFAVILLIPSAVAAINYFGTKNAPLSDAVINRISISDLDGKTFNLSRDDSSAEAKEMFSAFLEANSKATEVAALPDPLQGTKFFAVSFYGLEKTLNCQYYFQSDSTVAYYLDNDVDAFQLPEDFVLKFQNSVYGLSLYENATPPDMVLCGNNIITPQTADWKFKLADGSFSDTPVEVTPTVHDGYLVDGGLDISFTNAPDNFEISVKNNGKIIYNGSYADIGDALKFREQTSVEVLVDAEWYQDSARDYYGSTTYSFKADIAAPPAFALNKTEIEPGDFVLLSISNVTDVSRITFTSTPDINYTPTFYIDGDYARAFIPYNYDLEAGEYKMDIGYGASSTSLKVTVTEKKFKTSYSDITAAVEQATRTEESLKAFEDALTPIAKSGEATVYFSGKFFDCTEDVSGFSIQSGFGTTKTLTSTRTAFRHNGVDFKVKSGTDVNAVNAGKVIYVGETTLSGKLIVIEHGLGLKSWYAHLGTTSVAVGDTVTSGAVIGTVGNTGFTNGTTLHIGMSVFDVPVCIYPLWENDGIVIKNPVASDIPDVVDKSADETGDESADTTEAAETDKPEE